MNKKRITILQKREMMELRNEGFTYEEIGERYSLTKQRAFQILHAKSFIREAHVIQRLAKQNKCCDICGKPEAQMVSLMQLDHDHTTGKLRGLLCAPCNLGLGMFQDNDVFLRRAREYLQTWREEE